MGFWYKLLTKEHVYTPSHLLWCDTCFLLLVLINFYRSSRVRQTWLSSHATQCWVFDSLHQNTYDICRKFCLCWCACSKFTLSTGPLSITLWGWLWYAPECSTTKLVCWLVGWLLFFIHEFFFVCLFVLVAASQYPSECQEINPVGWDQLFWKGGVGMEKRKKRKEKEGKGKIHPHYG